MAFQGGVRPEETPKANLVGLWSAQTASDGDGLRCLDLGTQRILRESTKQILVPVLGPQSPSIGLCPPLVNRKKRWANESPIEGWFPLSNGERPRCEVVRNIIARPRLQHCPRRSSCPYPARWNPRTPAGRSFCVSMAQPDAWRPSDVVASDVQSVPKSATPPPGRPPKRLPFPRRPSQLYDRLRMELCSPTMTSTGPNSS